MYQYFYGLHEKPFNLTPDSHFFFLSEKHKEAIAHVRYGIDEKKGFILITGEIGAGKTTLCRKLLKEVAARYRIALILNPVVTPIGLLKAIITDLGIVTKARTTQDMMQVLYKFLLEEKNVIVVIDEAQRLSTVALEQIRLLGNLETEKDKLLQIVLVGQPELRDIVARPELRQLNQRIAVRFHIEHLNKEETIRYIYYRLKMAGDSGKIIFQEDAIEEIYYYADGLPRMINMLCDYCLMCGYVRETFVITKDLVKQAIQESQSTLPEGVTVG